MFNGEDPNWGRLIASVGASGIECIEEKIDMSFDDLAYVKKNGIIIDEILEEKAALIMKKRRN